MFNRRTLLKSMGAGGLLALARPEWSFAAAPGDVRLVVMLLRGAVDGLAAVPPHGDFRYEKARGAMALPRSGSEGGVIDLDGFYGLHPSLAPLQPLWESKELALVHATALPYNDRSHFDSQDVLENGTDRPLGSRTGWLNRALVGKTGEPAMAIGRTVPLILRGPQKVTSADPLRVWKPDNALLNAVADLYEADPQLGPALEIGIQTQAMLDVHRGRMRDAKRQKKRDFEKAARVLGGVLAADDGPRVAVVDLGGWDTHTGQSNGLNKLLEGLAGSVVGMREAMGSTWDKTVVLAMTEFGRTVHANGTAGTDHGTASFTMLAGGAVAGGKVYGEWPGLRDDQLFEGRDLQPTTDLRSISKGVLMAHLGVSDSAIEDSVFPDSRDAKPMLELIRS